MNEKITVPSVFGEDISLKDSLSKIEKTLSDMAEAQEEYQHEKELNLAELMDWKTHNHCVVHDEGDASHLEPYANSKNGRTQFAAIILEFPEAMQEFYVLEGEWQPVRPTQGNILDAVLRINDVSV